MPFFISTAAVCLIACHGGPADHFATFAEALSQDIATQIYATGPALKKFEEHGIQVQIPFSLDHISPEEEDSLAEQIADSCSNASVVITDMGHPFDIKVQKALARRAVHVTRLAYYDNPEAYVPGGYSAVAAEVMQVAQGVLFANANLAQEEIYQAPGVKVDFGSRKKIAVGYYPAHQAEKIAKRRKQEQSSLRQALFQKNNLEDTGQNILVYFGGNNEEYYSKTFPAFLSILEEAIEQKDCSDLVIVLQQHPGAKKQNLDRNLLEDWLSKQKNPHAPKVIISDFNSDIAQIVADGALYYQTSMGPQFVLAGIPTLQIGHETYEDILVKNRLCPSITSADQWNQVIDSLDQLNQEVPQEVILKGLGIKTDWLQILEKAILKNPFPV